MLCDDVCCWIDVELEERSGLMSGINEEMAVM
jgi:hypothetical protein